MSSVIFTFESFEIQNTRARHTDTDFVSFSLKIGDTLYGTQTKGMGDLNNWFYPVFLTFGPLEINDPSTPVHFDFMVANSGNHSGSIEDRLKSAGDTLAGGLAGAAGIVAGASTTQLENPVGWVYWPELSL
jgi:hypothetical protein